MFLHRVGLTIMVTCICMMPFLLSWWTVGIDAITSYCGWIGGAIIWLDCVEHIWSDRRYDDDEPPTFPGGGLPVTRTDARRGKAT